MCWLHRHQIHLIRNDSSYGCVSLTLTTTGLVFTIFAIFQKDSQIGKVWLAGPTTMVVGLVLCGKVIIDWGPAMLHGCDGSIDSFNQMSLHSNSLMIDSYKPMGGGATKAPLTYKNAMFDDEQTPFIMLQHAFVGAGADAKKKSTMVGAGGHIGLLIPPSPSLLPTAASKYVNGSTNAGRNNAIDCIVYGPFDGESATNTPSRQSQTSHTDDGSASIFNNPRGDGKTADDRNPARNEYATTSNKLTPPFLLTLPVAQTTLKNTIPMASTATQTYGSDSVDPACNCSPSFKTSEYYHISARVRCCAHCDEADENLTSLGAPYRLADASNQNSASSYEQPSSQSCQSQNSSWTNILNRQTFSYDEAIEPPTSHTLMASGQWIGNRAIYQGETFVVNDRNFFI